MCQGDQNLGHDDPPEFCWSIPSVKVELVKWEKLVSVPTFNYSNANATILGATASIGAYLLPQIQ